VLLAAIGLFMVTSVLCALAQTMPQLVIAGCSRGRRRGLRAVAQAVVATSSAARARALPGLFRRYLCRLDDARPGARGFFAEYLSWHWIFWINLPFGMLAFALSNHQLKRLKRPGRRPIIDWLGRC